MAFSKGFIVPSGRFSSAAAAVLSNLSNLSNCMPGAMEEHAATNGITATTLHFFREIFEKSYMLLSPLMGQACQNSWWSLKLENNVRGRQNKEPEIHIDHS